MVMGLFAVSAILLGRTFKSVPGCTAISELTGAHWHEGASILMESMISGGFLQVIDMSTHSLSNCMLIMNQLPQVLYRSSNATCCAINVVCPDIPAAIYVAAA